MDGHVPSNDEALTQLRTHLGLHEQVPVVNFTHPLTAIQGEDGYLLTICAHDEANEEAHAVELRLSESEFTGFDSATALTLARLSLTAVYN